MAPWGGNYFLYDIYLRQQRVEDNVVLFHLAERGNVVRLRDGKSVALFAWSKAPHRIVTVYSFYTN